MRNRTSPTIPKKDETEQQTQAEVNQTQEETKVTEEHKEVKQDEDEEFKVTKME